MKEEKWGDNERIGENREEETCEEQGGKTVKCDVPTMSQNSSKSSVPSPLCAAAAAILFNRGGNYLQPFPAGAGTSTSTLTGTGCLFPIPLNVHWLLQ